MARPQFPTPSGPMMGRIASLNSSGYTVETILDPHEQPFLHDHQIEGTPVLPGVMGIEGFAEAALSLLPGWQIESLEGINFLAPFKFYRSEPRALQIETRIHPDADQLVADCRLLGRRSLPNQTESQSTTHFTARVRLSKTLAMASQKSLGSPQGHIIGRSEIYQVYFHGPAYQVIEKAWWDGHRMISLMADNLSANHHPAELPLVMAPRLIELCFQTAGLWELGLLARMGLPRHVDSIRLYRQPRPDDGRLYAVFTPQANQPAFNVEVLDTTGNCYLRLAGYQTVALPNAVDAKRLNVLREIMSADSLLVA